MRTSFVGYPQKGINYVGYEGVATLLHLELEYVLESSKQRYAKSVLQNRIWAVIRCGFNLHITL
jgi:hypothetical protein